jgi:hypothetical protein
MVKKMKTKMTLALFTLLLVLPFLVNSTMAQEERFVAAINSPVEGEIITGNNVQLNFSLTNTGVLLSTIRSLPYIVNLDGQVYAQGDMGGNITNAGFSVNTTLALTNLTQGEHNVNVKITIFADSILPIPDEGPVKLGEESSTVNFATGNQQASPTPTNQPTQQQFPTTAIIIGVVTAAIIIVVCAAILYHRITMRQKKSNLQ